MTKKLSDTQKRILQHLVDGAYIAPNWNTNPLYSGTDEYLEGVRDTTLKALAPYLKSTIKLFHGFPRREVKIINDDGIELATELGYIVDDEAPADDSSVMDKDAGDVHEETPDDKHKVTLDEFKSLIMAEFGIKQWFSDEFDTIAEAKAAVGHVGIWARFGILQTTSGKYVWANLRITQWTDEEIIGIAAGIHKATGMRLIEWTSPFTWWLPVKGSE